MVKWYHASFPSLRRGFDSRYPLQLPSEFIKEVCTGSRCAIAGRCTLPGRLKPASRVRSPQYPPCRKPAGNLSVRYSAS